MSDNGSGHGRWLPNAKWARVPKSKLVDYLLNPHHPQGRGKARFFRSMGYSENNADRLAQDLVAVAVSNVVASARTTRYGVNYSVRGPIGTPAGRIVFVVTVWQVENGSTLPRLITAYPAGSEGSG